MVSNLSIFTSPKLVFYTQCMYLVYSLIGIVRLIGSLKVWTKVILLCGFYCTCTCQGGTWAGPPCKPPSARRRCRTWSGWRGRKPSTRPQPPPCRVSLAKAFPLPSGLPWRRWRRSSHRRSSRPGPARCRLQCQPEVQRVLKAQYYQLKKLHDRQFNVFVVISVIGFISVCEIVLRPFMFFLF